MLELNEVLIHLFVAVSLRINAILTQYYQPIKERKLYIEIKRIFQATTPVQLINGSTIFE